MFGQPCHGAEALGVRQAFALNISFSFQLSTQCIATSIPPRCQFDSASIPNQPTRCHRSVSAAQGSFSRSRIRRMSPRDCSAVQGCSVAYSAAQGYRRGSSAKVLAGARARNTYILELPAHWERQRLIFVLYRVISKQASKQASNSTYSDSNPNPLRISASPIVSIPLSQAHLSDKPSQFGQPQFDCPGVQSISSVFDQPS